MEDSMEWTWSQEETADLGTWARECEYVPVSHFLWLSKQHC